MTPEFKQQCLELYRKMAPEYFIEFLYSYASYEGRMDEIRRFIQVSQTRSEKEAVND